jgi:putative membrane protein
MSQSSLPFPEISAALNAAATILLTAGYLCFRQKHIAAHRACMMTAFCVSVVFLVCYVTGKYVRGLTYFDGQGFWRVFYFTLLTTHTILAIVIVPLILRTVWLALHGDYLRHRAWARWTFPLWYYVSVTGVLVYFILFHWFPHHTVPLVAT